MSQHTLRAILLACCYWISVLFFYHLHGKYWNWLMIVVSQNQDFSKCVILLLSSKWLAIIHHFWNGAMKRHFLNHRESKDCKGGRNWEISVYDCVYMVCTKIHFHYKMIELCLCVIFFSYFVIHFIFFWSPEKISYLHAQTYPQSTYS